LGRERNDSRGSRRRHSVQRGNVVGVIANGAAELEPGAIGPPTAKSLMKGKGVLFKRFASIDLFKIEFNELDPDKLADIIAVLEPTFDGINLEEIKAPESSCVERELRDRMKTADRSR
jgi:malate dehydrogenase (oxaloacetate-decarboxylating)(NADP+)